MSPCAHSQSKAGGFRHRTARGCWPEGKVPSGRAAAKDAARRSMRRMYRDHGDWHKLRGSSMRRKRRFERPRKEPACLWTTSWADRGAPPGVSSMIGTTRPSCIRCAAWRIGPPKIRSFTRTCPRSGRCSRPTGLPLAIDQAAHDRGRDFLFAPSPPNLRLVSEGEKDGYR